MAKKFKMIVFSQPHEGREDEYNDWYQNRHLGEVIATPGFTAAQRFKLSGKLSEDMPAYPYCAIYEYSADDWAVPFNALSERANSGEIFMTDAINTEDLQFLVYEEFGDEVRRVA